MNTVAKVVVLLLRVKDGDVHNVCLVRSRISFEKLLAFLEAAPPMCIIMGFTAESMWVLVSLRRPGEWLGTDIRNKMSIIVLFSWHRKSKIQKCLN